MGTGSAGSVFGDIVLSIHLGYKTRESLKLALWLHVVLRLPGSLPRSLSSGTGPSASCGYCCPLCPTRGRYLGKIFLLSPRGLMGTRGLCRVPPAAVRHGSAWKSSGTGPCWDCRRVLWGTGPAGSVSGENSFYSET